MKNKRGIVMIEGIVCALGLTVILISALLTIETQVRSARIQVQRQRTRMVLSAELDYLKTCNQSEFSSLKTGDFKPVLKSSSKGMPMTFTRDIEEVSANVYKVTLFADFPEDVFKGKGLSAEGVYYVKN